MWAAGAFDWAAVDEADPGAWEHLINVNLTAAAVTTRMLVPRLIGSAPSSLLHIGSGASRQAFANNAACERGCPTEIRIETHRIL